MARRTEKKMKEAGFKFGFGVGKPTSNIMEGIRRRLSKTGLSAADRKKLKELQAKQQKRDAAKTAGERAAKAKIGAAEKKAKETSKKSMTDAQKRRMAASPKSAMSDKQKQGQVKKRTGTKSVMSDAQKKGQAGTRQTKKDFGPKGKGTPKTVGAAQKAGSMFFFRKNKDGSQTKMLAVTAEQKKKLGMSLTAIANKYKGKDGMKRMLADLKKKKMAMGGAMMKKKGMAMGGSMKKKGMAMGGMKKKGMARGGMKKKGYAMGGLKATNPSQVGLRKLPESVRNKMGYMKKGGMTKKGYARGGSMKKKGYAMGGVAKKYGMVDNRKKKR